jgi:poly-gamma-glutamate synthesis protein (capsule biosynthesis protein)
MVRRSTRLAALLLGCCLAADVVAVTWAGPRSAAPAGLGAPVAGRPPATGDTAAYAAPSSAATRAPSSPATSVPDPVPRDRITLAFAGDVHFERQVRALLDRSEPLTAAVRDTLGRADFAMVNLETALGTGGTPLPGKDFTFRAPVSSLSVLAAAGVDAVSMANNHAADFGDAVFGQTLAARRSAPVPIVGIGRDEAEAFTPLRVDVHGVKVAVLASSQIRDVTSREHAAGSGSPGIAANLDPGPLRRAVRAAAASSDVVVVMLHWGTQYTSCADDRQRETARLLAADGADVIVGGHAHRPQGSGWSGRAYVAYGLGNFVWYNNDGPAADTGVLTVTVDAAAARRKPHQRSVVSAAAWSPMVVGSDGVPRAAAAGATRARLLAGWDTATRCAGLAVRPS